MQTPVTTMLISIALLSSTMSYAETKRDLDSHEHGAASLNVVVDGASVFIEFDSPWVNLVGFEHKPSTDAQKAAMSDAKKLLGEPQRLFETSAQSGCVARTIGITDSLDEHSEHDEHSDEHSEHKHSGEHSEHDEHSDEHSEHAEHSDEHSEHAEHSDEHSEHAEHDHSDTHSEIRADFELECENIDALESLTVTLFDHWGGVESLAVQFVSAEAQLSLELTDQNRVINFGG